jgi:drug/metabolite transporter (DMT)-like permease
MRLDSKTKTLAADGAMLLAAFFWGAGYPVMAVALGAFSPLWLLALRLGGGGLLMALLFRRSLLRLPPRHWAMGLGVGLLVSLAFLFSIYGLVLSTAGKQSFIAGINVVLVPFLVAAIYRRRPSGWAFSAATLTSLGLLVMAFTPGMRFNLGDFLSLLLAVCVAFHVLAVGWASRRMDPLALATGQLLGSGGICLIAALFLEPVPLWTGLAPDAWGALTFLVLFPSVAAFIIQSVAQRFTSETHAAILLSLESLFGYLLTLAMGQEPFRLQIALGGGIILAGVLMAEAESLFLDRVALGGKSAAGTGEGLP